MGFKLLVGVRVDHLVAVFFERARVRRCVGQGDKEELSGIPAEPSFCWVTEYFPGAVFEERVLALNGASVAVVDVRPAFTAVVAGLKPNVCGEFGISCLSVSGFLRAERNSE